MARAPRLKLALPLLARGLAGARVPACVPRQQLDECRRLSQTLRSENAQLKDQMLALKGQNRDFAERAVDDSRRLAQLEEVESTGSKPAFRPTRTNGPSSNPRSRSCAPACRAHLSPFPSSQRGGPEPSRPRCGNALDPESEPGPRRSTIPTSSRPKAPGPRRAGAPDPGRAQAAAATTPGFPRDPTDARSRCRVSSPTHRPLTWDLTGFS